MYGDLEDDELAEEERAVRAMLSDEDREAVEGVGERARSALAPVTGAYAEREDEAIASLASDGDGAFAREQSARAAVDPEVARARIAAVDARLRSPGGAQAIERDVTAGRDAAEEAVRAEMPEAPQTAVPPSAVAIPPARGASGAMPERGADLGDPNEEAESRALAQLANQPGASSLEGPREGALALATPSAKTPTRQPSLDDGLPSQAAIDDASGLDAGRRALHALSAGLLAYAGRSPMATDGHREENRLRRMRDEGLEERMGAKQQARGEERQEASALRESREAEREGALAERAAARADALASATIGRTEAQTAGETAERAQAAARTDPRSEESRAAVATTRSLLESVSQLPGAQSRVAPILAQLEGMNAEQAEELVQRAPPWLRDLLHRRGGGGAGGGSSGPRLAQARDQMRAALIARGMAPEAADAAIATMRPRDVARALVTDGLSTARAETSADRVDDRQETQRGTRVDRDVRALGQGLDSALPWRQAIRRARTVDPGLLRAVFLSEDLPPGATPQAIQEARGAVNQLRSSLGRALSGAAISEAEFARITQQMNAGATSSPEAFLSWLETQEQDESERAARIRARFGEDVVREYDANLQREQAPEAPGAAPTAPGSPGAVPAGARTDSAGNVVMRRPDGSLRRVPRDRVAARRAEGWAIDAGGAP